MKKLPVVLFSIIILSACSANKEAQKDSKHNLKNETNKVIEGIYSPVTGLPTHNKNGQHFSVMIENSPNARPQTGLINADIVYEMKTEGNISRYLAFFHDNIPKTVGPVRSSRHYFIPLSEEMNYPYIHFGASTYAYEYLNSAEFSIPHIDGINQGNFFFRDKSRKAPHNAYLDTKSLDDYSKIIINNQHFIHKNKEEKLMNNPIALVSFKYNDFTHITYKLNASENIYYRFQENKPHIDKETGEQIKVKNIILQFAVHRQIMDDKKGRIDIALDEQGDYIYISNGKKTEGHWKKDKINNCTTYYNNDGEILSINPGNTWIQILEKNQNIVIE